ncbi:TPA: XRE family transcriptional regulator, partial [Enterococcus faecalis]
EEKEINTVAAHIDDDVTEDEMNEILSFIDYIKKRDHNN